LPTRPTSAGGFNIGWVGRLVVFIGFEGSKDTRGLGSFKDPSPKGACRPTEGLVFDKTPFKKPQ